MIQFFTRHWIGVLIALVALGVAAASWYFARPALEVLRLARVSSTWTPVEADVVSATIDSSFSSVSTGSGNYHEPKVQFSYVVDGRSYESDIILFGHLRLTNRQGRLAANRILDPYRNNPTVTAFYNPDNPAQAVLEPGFKLRSLHGLVNAGIGFAITLGLLVLAVWLESPLKPNDAT